MSKTRDNYDFLTAAPIARVIGALSVPTIITMLTSSLYSIVDTFFVSQINTQATAAVGIVFAVTAVLQAVAFCFGHGSGNYISRRLGAKDMAAATRMASTGFFWSLIVGVLLMAVGLLLLTPLSLWLGSTPTVLPFTEAYLSIILLGTPFQIGSMVLNNQLRFQGNAASAMTGIVCGTVLNVVLDPIFIFGFHMGIRGAAVATVTGHVCSFCILLFMTHRRGNIGIHWRHFSPSWQLVREILSGGTPSLTRQGLGSIATILLNVAAARYGDAAIAAMSIVGRLSYVINSVIIGVGQGFQPLCGFSYGAGLYDRVRRAYWFCVRIGTVFLLVCSTAGFIFSANIIASFRDDVDVISIGTLALRIQLLSLPLCAFIMLSNMLMQTINMPLRANLLAAARRGLFFIPLILLLPRIYGLLGVQMCQAVSDVLSFLLSLPIVFSTFRDMQRKAQ
ncbi:MAG: MATE family efflux transporter [Prevotellaceae bacterium]|nr:MATE family efflux transporter [Prevotellaceae bacterium]